MCRIYSYGAFLHGGCISRTASLTYGSYCRPGTQTPAGSTGCAEHDEFLHCNRCLTVAARAEGSTRDSGQRWHRGGAASPGRLGTSARVRLGKSTGIVVAQKTQGTGPVRGEIRTGLQDQARDRGSQGSSRGRATRAWPTAASRPKPLDGTRAESTCKGRSRRFPPTPTPGATARS